MLGQPPHSLIDKRQIIISSGLVSTTIDTIHHSPLTKEKSSYISVSLNQPISPYHRYIFQRSALKLTSKRFLKSSLPVGGSLTFWRIIRDFRDGSFIF